MSYTPGDVLRVTSLDDYIGQPKLKERLRVEIKAAFDEHRLLSHLLLTGPTGVGKTSLALAVAGEMRDPVHFMTLPWKDEDLRIMSRGFPPAEGQKPKPGFDGILVIDEVHKATKQEINELNTLLTDKVLRVAKAKRSIRPIAFTLIACTEYPGMLPRSFRDRFIEPTFEDFTDEDMAHIVLGMARKLEMDVDPEMAHAFGHASGGTPRVAGNFLKSAKSMTYTLGRMPTTEEVFAFCQVEPDGLNPNHVRYLLAMEEAVGPVGEQGLVNLLRRSKEEIRELERLLVVLGYIEPTQRGRELTTRGYQRATELRGQ